MDSVEGLKNALDVDDETADDDGDVFGPELSPFVPTSPAELFLAFLFAFPSLLFLLYLLLVFYR